MNEEPKYPTITEATLVPFRVLKIQMDKDPTLLHRAECPYSPTMKSFLLELLEREKGEVKTYDDDDLFRETVELYDDVKKSSLGIGNADAKDKVAILKNTADLLTKLMDLRAKAMNIREMSRFQKVVLDCLDGVVTTDQRAEFIEKLGKYNDL